jgi:hypothetical protein
VKFRQSKKTEPPAENPKPATVRQFTLETTVLVDVPGYGPVVVLIGARVAPVKEMLTPWSGDPDRGFPSKADALRAIRRALDEDK